MVSITKAIAAPSGDQRGTNVDFELVGDHLDVVAIGIHNENLKPEVVSYFLKTGSNKSNVPAVPGPVGLSRSYGCQPVNIGAISLHNVYISLPMPVADKKDSAVRRPPWRYVSTRLGGQPCLVAAVGIHRIDF